MPTRKTINCGITGLLAVALTVLPSSALQPAEAAKAVKGFVLVSSTTTGPSTIKTSQKDCVTATVQVFVQRGTFNNDNPTVTVSLAKASSDPDNLEVEITPVSRRATITESTGNFRFKVCAQREKAMTGKVTLKSSIANWGPQEKFDRKGEEPKYELTAITIEN